MRRAGLAMAGLAPLALSGQLAITEVMSEAITNGAFKGSDYWELTHFGTNAIPLDGYYFTDNITDREVRSVFEGLVIHPGESVVFFRSQEGRSVTTAEDFRAWWGPDRVPASVQIRSYASPGFDGDLGDEVWLFDPEGRKVDQVRFGAAKMGRSFTYDPESGSFGLTSVLEVGHAFRAQAAPDVGSPGRNSGAALLRLLQGPASQTVDAGMSVTFSVIALGMPQPRYQWMTGNALIAGASGAALTLPVVQVSDAGSYRVRVDNGLSTLLSLPATLSVSTTRRPPMLATAPSNSVVLPGQTGRFSVFARGYPAPRYQWSVEGVSLPGETNTTLWVPRADAGMSGLQYSVTVWNSLGSTSAAARLYVVPRPRLRFTEVMPWTASVSPTPHHDWFELTNGGTNAQDLAGYRFSDKPLLVDAVTITNHLVVQPGESVVFAQQTPPEFFKAWWGADRLPPGLQVYSYLGFGLNKLGEALFLWNPAATDSQDYLSTVTWASTTPGVSLECANDCDSYPEYGCLGQCVRDSALGVGFTFASADPGDLGSPGYAGDLPPRVTALLKQDDQFWVECQTTPGRFCRLWWSPQIQPPLWQEVTYIWAESALVWMSDPAQDIGENRFYRVELMPESIGD